MITVLIKNGKRVAAFYNAKGTGYVEIDYNSPLAIIFSYDLIQSF